VKPVAKKSMSCLSVLGTLVLLASGAGVLLASLVR
jgi:hypothetical protein